MGLSPRSIAHALRLHVESPRLRVTRTHAGTRAMVFDAPESPVRAQPAPAPLGEMSAGPALDAPAARGRFIDDPVEVGWRHSLVRAAREGMDHFVPDQPRQQALADAFGPLEPVRVPGPDGGEVERQALRLTPHVRKQVLGGRMRLAMGDQVGRKWGYEPRDFVLAYNDGARNLDIGLDLGIDPERSDVAALVDNRLSIIRNRVRPLMDQPGELASLAEAWRVTPEELRKFVENADGRAAHRRTPSLVAHLRQVAEGGVTDTERLKRAAREWVPPDGKDRPGESVIKVTVSRLRNELGLSEQRFSPMGTLTPSQKARVKALRKEGVGSLAIGRELGVTPKVVEDAVRRFRAKGEVFPPLRGGAGRSKFAMGEALPTDSDGYIKNENGWLLLLPFEEKWGNPRFDEQDKGAAMARLSEIREADWRKSSWEDVVRAHDDINEILEQHFFWKPGTSADQVKQDLGLETRMYMRERDASETFGVGLTSILLASESHPRPPDLADVGDAARNAVEAMISSRRAGVLDLLRFGRRSPKAGGRDAPPVEVAPPDRAGFVSAVRRAVEQLPEAAFSRDGLGLYNTIAKQRHVTKPELEFTGLFDMLTKRAAPISREELLKWIDANALRLVRRNNEFDPALPTRKYDYGGTRAFDGPRIPGPGRYFEERLAFPKRTRGGRAVAASDMASGHWEEGVWGSIRGSVREDPKYGRGVLGEELQRDPYQKINSGRVKKLPEAEYRVFTEEKKAYNRVRTDTANRVRVLWQAYVDSGAASRPRIELGDATDSVLAGDLAPLEQMVGAMRGVFDRGDDAARAKVRGLISDAEFRLNTIKHDIERDPRWFSAEAVKKFNTSTVAAPPLTDAASTRVLVRALFTRAAREGADWVAVPTGKTNDRIQANSYASAAHYYDGAVKRELERVARDIGGDAMKVERVALATPPLKRGAAVYMVRGITPEMHARIKSEGLPLFAANAPAPRRIYTPDEIEAEVRTAWNGAGAAFLASGEIDIVPTYKDAPGEGWVRPPPGTAAVYLNGVTTIIAESTTPARVRSLLLHEIGVHAGLEAMMGKGRFRTLLKKVEQRVAHFRELRDRGEGDDAGDLWLEAADGAEAGILNPAYLTEETIAYVVETVDNDLTHFPDAADRTLVQTILDAVRRWFTTTTGIGKITPRDLHTLAAASLRSQARRADKGVAPGAALMGRADLIRLAVERGFDGADARGALKFLHGGAPQRRTKLETISRADVAGAGEGLPGKGDANTAVAAAAVGAAAAPRVAGGAVAVFWLEPPGVGGAWRGPPPPRRLWPAERWRLTNSSKAARRARPNTNACAPRTRKPRQPAPRMTSSKPTPPSTRGR